MSLISAILLLFLVMDPFGNVPLFILALQNVREERRQPVILRELVLALGVLIVFLFCGQWILRLLHVSEQSLSISGGIILFLIALRMIFGGSEQMFEPRPGDEPFLFPLAVPAVAGPSAIATVMLLMAHEPSRWTEWLLALLIAWAAGGLIMMSSMKLNRILGKRGLKAMERLMGMLLTLIAVEMFLDGLMQLNWRGIV